MNRLLHFRVFLLPALLITRNRRVSTRTHLGFIEYRILLLLFLSGVVGGLFVILPPDEIEGVLEIVVLSVDGKL